MGTTFAIAASTLRCSTRRFPRTLPAKHSQQHTDSALYRNKRTIRIEVRVVVHARRPSALVAVGGRWRRAAAATRPAAAAAAALEVVVAVVGVALNEGEDKSGVAHGYSCSRVRVYIRWAARSKGSQYPNNFWLGYCDSRLPQNLSTSFGDH